MTMAHNGAPQWKSRVATATVLLGVSAAIAGCSGQPTTGKHPGHSAAPTFVAPPAARAEPVRKMLVVIEENHSLDEMRAGMPYTFGLAKRFGYATDYHAVSHPSLPNYLAIVGGSTFGITDDHPPVAHPVRVPSVFADGLARGRSVAVYADGMPGNCAPSNGGDNYAVRHNPWAYFGAEQSACRKFDVPASRLHDDITRGHLPNLGLVIPNTCHDAHDCGLATADAWFAKLMHDIFSGPDWRSGRLAVVLTADEDDHNQDNKVLTVVAHPSQHQHVVRVRLDHYSLLRALEDVAGAPHRGKAVGAASLSGAFNLPIAKPSKLN